jgi:hypothetical protein
VLLALAGCRAAAAAAPSDDAPPLPPNRQVACSATLDPTAPAEADAGRQRLPALLGLLSDGRPLADALRQLYGKPISALTTSEQADALYLLSGLDACPTLRPDVTADVPRLVRLIALGAPSAVPLTVAPPMQAGPPGNAEPSGGNAEPTGPAQATP